MRINLQDIPPFVGHLDGIPPLLYGVLPSLGPERRSLSTAGLDQRVLLRGELKVLYSMVLGEDAKLNLV